jgi:hypothetical protein
MHVAGVNKEIDSIDTYTYRKAEEKATVIGEIEMVLKENAIDCYLNKQINHIQKGQVKPIDLITSRGIKINKHEVYDKEFSKICSFSNCNFSCECLDVNENDINYDTFTLKNSKDLFIQVKQVITELYGIHNYYT